MFWESGAIGCNYTDSLNHSFERAFWNKENSRAPPNQSGFVRKPGTNDVECMDWTEGLTKTRQRRLVKKNRCVTQ